MLNKNLLMGIFFGIGLLLQAQTNTKATPIIFDSDMGFDYDDVGALAMLHALEDNGEAEILATVASTNYDNVASVFDVINTYYHKPHLPVGVPAGTALGLRDSQKWSDTLVARYPHDLRRNADAFEAVALYRSILAKQEDQSVSLLSVGFLTNLEALLKSGPDEYSPLSGKELLNRKVSRLVSMAGKFPEGLEFNIEEDAAAAKYVFENIEVPVIFAGFELGNQVLTGLPLVQNKQIQNSPIQDVYRISMAQAASDSAGRMSWDQLAVLAAVRGPEPYFGLKNGAIEIDEDGSNKWRSNGSGQAYLTEKMDLQEIQDLIDQYMMQQPQKAASEQQGLEQENLVNEKPLVVFVIGDHEYSSELTMPIIAEELNDHYGMDVRVLTSYPDHNAEENIPGLEVLADADLAVFFLRWRRLPKQQVEHIENYLESGRPVVGLRTSTHAFNYPEGHELEKWNAFGEFAFNSPPGWEKKGHTHYGHESTTKVRVIEEAEDDPVLTGVKSAFPAASWLYTVLPDYPLEGSKRLLMGTPVNPDDPEAIEHPVAWKGTNSFGGKFFMTTLGHPEDFQQESMVRLIINAIHWSLGQPVPTELKNEVKINVPYGTHK